MGAVAAQQLIGQQFNMTQLVVEGAIGIYLYKGTQAVDKPDDTPYQYLTELQKAEHDTIRGTFPLGTTQGTLTT